MVKRYVVAIRKNKKISYFGFDKMKNRTGFIKSVKKKMPSVDYATTTINMGKKSKRKR